MTLISYFSLLIKYQDSRSKLGWLSAIVWVSQVWS